MEKKQKPQISEEALASWKEIIAKQREAARKGLTDKEIEEYLQQKRAVSTLSWFQDFNI